MGLPYLLEKMVGLIAGIDSSHAWLQKHHAASASRPSATNHSAYVCGGRGTSRLLKYRWLVRLDHSRYRHVQFRAVQEGP